MEFQHVPRCTFSWQLLEAFVYRLAKTWLLLNQMGKPQKIDMICFPPDWREEWSAERGE